MAKKKTKKDETVDGVKFPSKDELRKMYSTPDDVAKLKKLDEELQRLQLRWYNTKNEDERLMFSEKVQEVKIQINELKK